MLLDHRGHIGIKTVIVNSKELPLEADDNVPDSGEGLGRSRAANRIS